jgi:hypothetical protein
MHADRKTGLPGLNFATTAKVKSYPLCLVPDVLWRISSLHHVSKKVTVEGDTMDVQPGRPADQ